MNALALALAILFVTLIATAYGAHREGSERRDVVALGTSGALGGLAL